MVFGEGREIYIDYKQNKNGSINLDSFPIVERLVFTLNIVRVQLAHGEDKFRQIVQRPSGPFR
jgi:hypothetical protein